MTVSIDTSRAALARDSLLRWLTGQALPMWADTGTDLIGGGFFEKIDRDGLPLHEPRRTRVVARQVYVYAVAARLGWWPEADELVTHGLLFMLGRLRRADGLFAQAVQPQGEVVRGGFDLYEQAFALFALAEASRGRPDRLLALEPVADAALAALVAGWKHPRIGFQESNPPSAPLRSNPHMHLFEAALSWAEVTTGASSARWGALADELAELALTQFIDPATGALGEYFDAQWQPMNGFADQSVEPGHQFEWSWLLQRWGSLRDRGDALTAARRLDQIGETLGVDARRNVAINELDGRFAPTDAAGRLWPQTERLKSACAAWADAPSQAASDRIARCADGMAQFFLASPAGLWNERMRPDGSFESDDCRASSLYHIFCAIDTLRATAL